MAPPLPPMLESGEVSTRRVGHPAGLLAGMVIFTRLLAVALDYLEGRWGSPSILGSVVLLLIALGCIVTLLAMGVNSIIQRKGQRPVMCCLGLSVLVFLAGFLIRPADVFRIGFRHGIQATVSPADLHQIAQVCSELLPVDGKLPGPEKWSLWKEAEHRRPWDALTKTTTIGKLHPALLIFNRSEEVEIVWGGALAGHWGVVIQKDPGASGGDIAPGIKTFISSN